jgi:hypothetical protein
VLIEKTKKINFESLLTIFEVIVFEATGLADTIGSSLKPNARNQVTSKSSINTVLTSVFVLDTNWLNKMEQIKNH